MPRRKLTITVDDDVYRALHAVIGRRKISAFLNDLARPHVVKKLDSGYAAMAADSERETDAQQWSDNLISDVSADE